MDKNDKQTKQNKRLVAYVRFTEDEHLQIKNDEKILGKTIPQLLKRTYFKGAIKRLLIEFDMARKIKMGSCQ